MNSFEVERKFLVLDARFVGDLLSSHRPQHIRQSYLVVNGFGEVRVRQTDHSATFTVKGPRSGDTRREYECEIDSMVADIAISVARDAVVEKNRYGLVDGGRTWVVDVFLGANRGLVLAEIEAADAGSAHTPAWCAREVTNEESFYNKSLASRPLSSWASREDYVNAAAL